MGVEESLGLDLMQQSAIREIANIGLGNATTSLATMTGRFFNMTVPFVESVRLEALPALLGGFEQLTVGIYMKVEGDVPGYMGFLMTWESAQSLWQSLLGQCPQTLEDIDPLASSTLLEIGNIINSGFLVAIGDMTNLELRSTPPEMGADMAGSILSSIVTEASMGDFTALSIRTEIFDESHSFEGFFVYIPSNGGLQKLFETLGIATPIAEEAA